MHWVLTAALVAACSNSKSSAPAAGSSTSAPAASGSSRKADMSKFALSVVGEDSKVNVELAVPASWSVDVADPPSWKMEGARLSLAAVSPGGRDDAARLEKAIKMQYSDLAGAARADYPDGRVWIALPEGANVHARMFVPYASGVVMGVAILSDASRADAIKAAFETLKVVP